MRVQHSLTSIQESILCALDILDRAGVRRADSYELALAVHILTTRKLDAADLIPPLVVPDRKTLVIPDTEASKSQDIVDDLRGLRFLGLIMNSGAPLPRSILNDDNAKFSLTEHGVRIAKAVRSHRMVRIRPPVMTQTTIFIASAFGRADTDALYARSFEPSCRDLGFASVRVDLTEHLESITSAVLSGIDEAAAVLADLTYARPSVYFEVGLAHGLGVPIVLTCRSDHYRSRKDALRVHFDLEQYKISYWTRTEADAFRWPPRMNPLARLRKVTTGLRGTDALHD